MTLTSPVFVSWDSSFSFTRSIFTGSPSAAHAPDTTDVKVPLEDDDVPTIEMPDIPEKPERPMDAPSIHTDDEAPAE